MYCPCDVLQVRDKLVAACVARGVRMRYGASLEGLTPITPISTPQDHEDVQGSAQVQDAAQNGTGTAHAEEVAAAVTSVAGKRGKGTRKGGKGKQPHQVSPGWACQLADGSTHITDRLVSVYMLMFIC